MLDFSNSSEVHAIVHQGRVVAELLVKFNLSDPDSFQLENNRLEACSLLAL
jgi:hypothetical protein